jgi:hypothetical protein
VDMQPPFPPPGELSEGERERQIRYGYIQSEHGAGRWMEVNVPQQQRRQQQVLSWMLCCVCPAWICVRVPPRCGGRDFVRLSLSYASASVLVNR